MNIADHSLLALSQEIRLGKVTPSEATDAMLDRIAKVDPEIGAFNHVDGESARENAHILDRELEGGKWRGPLHGVPLAVKDIFNVEGWPSEIGMRVRRGEVSTSSATVVNRLRAGGAVILGKVHTTEGVYAEHTLPFVAPRNPWNHDRWIGASSSGSAAATAARLTFAALASDTGGSIRMPSAATGMTGIKPTWGRVSRAGVFELAATLDHVGVIARSAADAGTVLQVMAGHDPSDPTSAQNPVPNYPWAPQTLAGIRVGIDMSWIQSEVTSEVAEGVLSMVDTLVALGVDIIPVFLPDPTVINDDWFVVCGVQAARSHQSTFEQFPERFGAALASLITSGFRTSAIEYQTVLDRRTAFTGRLRSVFADVDALVMPALPFVAPPASDMLQMSAEMVARIHRFTVPFTMSGLPSVTVPTGFDSAGMPLAAQIITDAFSERLALQIAVAFQDVSDWHLRRPPGLV